MSRSLHVPILLAVMVPVLTGGWRAVPCVGPGSKMLTPWGEKLDSEKVLQKYPRPQLQRADWTNLNGIWEYAITTNAAYTSASPWDDKRTCGELVEKGEILVPFAIESPLSGVGRLLGPTELLWYRRPIDVRKTVGRRVRLNFGAVDYRCQVFVGHREVTDVPHEGGFLPFSLDITDFVADGTNELVVCVWDPTSEHFGGRGKQTLRPEGCSYTRVSGIWQTVWLESVPETRIAGYRVVPDIDAKKVTFDFEIDGPEHGAEIVVSVLDQERLVATDRGQVSRGVTIPLPDDCKLWSPESPNLYSFKAIYGEDLITGYFAMRKIGKRKDARGVLRFYLNDEPCFFLGPLDQGWWPDGLLTPPSEAAMEFDIRTIKSLGCNMMRKHMKIEPAYYYYLCDKIGLLVVQDMPPGGGERNTMYATARREAKEEIDALFNMPSIVMWVPYNEDWGAQPGEFLTHMTLDWIKRYDPTRLVDGPSGYIDYEGGDFGHDPAKRAVCPHFPANVCEAGDAVDMHFYRGPGMPPVNDRRVSFLGEFGGIGCAIDGHQWWPTRSFECYEGNVRKSEIDAVYEELMDRLAELAGRGLGGAVYTQTTDVELEINGYLTFDRKVVKFNAERVAAAHRKVLNAARAGAVAERKEKDCP